MHEQKSEVQGAICTLDSKRGFGFIRVDDEDREIYFNVGDIPPSDKVVKIGTRLKGRIKNTPKGPALKDLKVLTGQATNAYQFYGWGAVGAAVCISGALWAFFPLTPLVAILLGVNFCSLVFMGLDKALARSNAIRTPEAVVYTLALLGGTPGAILGIHVFKHKTRKAAFQFVLLLIAAAQVVVLTSLGIRFR